MALFDDRRFLLSHINHSFITGDDTGICEVVMLDEDVFENQHQQCLKLEGQNDDDEPENRLEPKAYDLDYESDLFESEQGQSYDIASDLDYICHRRRSNTAQRLDRLKKEKINQSRTKTIVWRCSSPTNSHSEERLSQDSPTSLNPTTQDGTNANNKFENGFIGTKKSKSPPSKSGLTKLLEKYPSLPKNPFDEFAQFDGGMSETVPVKKIMIFIAIESHKQLQQQQQQQRGMKEADHDAAANATTTNNVSIIVGSPSDSKEIDDSINQPTSSNNNNNIQDLNTTKRMNDQFKTLQITNNNNKKPRNNGPLEVVIVSTAKVQDLIGLICWQYTNEGREPKLHHDIDKYCLRISEDNGEVDPDFTSLNPKEPLSKFNFPSLALTEKSEDKIRINSYNNNTDNQLIASNNNNTNGTDINNIRRQCTNGAVYTDRIPSMASNVITSTSRLSNAGSRLAALTRIIFRDAKLATNNNS